MKNMPEYCGDPLAENEYLLKLREEGDDEPNTGFLTKLTQKKQIPKSFEDWPNSRYGYTKKIVLPIYVFKEEFRSGWKIHDWRFGESQNWATMIHPEGFTVEIYLTNLLDIITENTVINGELQGEFKWVSHKLEKK